MRKWRMRCIGFLSFLLILYSCGQRVSYTREVEAALESLDEVICNKEMLEGQKENRIARLKAAMGHPRSDREMYEVYDDLFDEYFQYNIDSTMLYAHRKLELAEKTGDEALKVDAVMDLAERYTMSGLYDAALGLFDEYSYARKDVPRYLSVLNTVYTNLEISSNDIRLAARYRALKETCQSELLLNLSEDDISHIFVETDMLLHQNRNREVLDILLPWIEDHSPALEDKGIIYYTLARAYSMVGDRGNAILWYARSAECDLMVPKYEYRSLYELAGCLYENGDIERAYAYITRSVEDAIQSNAQLHKQFSYQILPVISDSYNSHVAQKNKAILYAFLFASMLLVLLIIVMVGIFRERSRALLAEKQTRESNRQLMILTEELQKNVQILKETNQIKEMYLGRYLSMCSDYIDGLERYRTSLRKVGRDGGDIMSALKSKEFMENALEEFYSQFDATFLDLFPDFISQLNGLLQEDKRVSYHSEERLLTTELRVLALIRLGISDSVKIAGFLRRSVSTVYNYRVKMRNSSVCDRDEFENRLMNIGGRV